MADPVSSHIVRLRDCVCIAMHVLAEHDNETENIRAAVMHQLVAVPPVTREENPADANDPLHTIDMYINCELLVERAKWRRVYESTLRDAIQNLSEGLGRKIPSSAVNAVIFRM